MGLDPDHPLPQDSGPGPDQAGHVQCVSAPVQSGSDENTVSVLLPLSVVVMDDVQ